MAGSAHTLILSHSSRVVAAPCQTLMLLVYLGITEYSLLRASAISGIRNNWRVYDTTNRCPYGAFRTWRISPLVRKRCVTANVLIAITYWRIRPALSCRWLRTIRVTGLGSSAIRTWQRRPVTARRTRACNLDVRVESTKLQVIQVRNVQVTHSSKRARVFTIEDCLRGTVLGKVRARPATALVTANQAWNFRIRTKISCQVKGSNTRLMWWLALCKGRMNYHPSSRPWSWLLECRLLCHHMSLR